MYLKSVNLGQARQLIVGDTAKTTGIFKEAAALPVQVTSLGLSGDTIISTKHHGGPDQAIYIYTQPDYDWWEAQLGQELPSGAFGNNLVISELFSADVAAGDRFVIGSAPNAVILEATSPRIPCSTFARRMDDPDFIARFRQAGRPGIYCRVIQEGMIEPGLPVEYFPYTGERVTMLDQFRDYYEPQTEAAAVERILAAPIAIRTRLHQKKRLAQLQQA